MAFMSIGNNRVRVIKDGSLYEFVRSYESNGSTIYCISKKDDGSTEVSTLERSELPKNEYEAIRLLNNLKVIGEFYGH